MKMGVVPLAPSARVYWGVGAVTAAVALTVGFLLTGQARAAEPLLQLADLAALDRENELWKIVRVTDEIEATVTRWRAAGFSEAEVAAARPKLSAIWDTTPSRQYGWLSPDAVEKIKRIDTAFAAQMRATRLRLVTGIQAEGFGFALPLQVEAQWRRAILRALDHREIVEFNLMNNRIAQRIEGWAAEVRLSTDERRTLIEWQREFALVHGAPEAWNGTSVSEKNWHERAQGEWHDRIRALLGDERAAVYLAEAHRPLARLSEAVAELDLPATQVLDLWSLRRDYQLETRREADPQARRELTAATRARVEALLGAEKFGVYAKLDDARWLFPRVIERAPRRK